MSIAVKVVGFDTDSPAWAGYGKTVAGRRVRFAGSQEWLLELANVFVDAEDSVWIEVHPDQVTDWSGRPYPWETVNRFSPEEMIGQ